MGASRGTLRTENREPRTPESAQPTVVSRRPRRTGWPRRLKPLVFAACLVPLAALAYRAFQGTLSANPVRDLEIQTGLWTLRLLAASLTVTPLRLVAGWGWLAQYRRMLGLFTFFYATVHLAIWTGVDWFFDLGAMGHEIAKHRYILIGMLTWLVLVPLAITSTKGWIRRLGGARWNRLHRLVYVAAVTGTVHYLWAVKKDTFFPLVYLAVFAVLLGSRLALRRRGRRGPAAA